MSTEYYGFSDPKSLYIGISMDFSVGNFTTSYSHDATITVSSYPFSITCLVGSIEDFPMYDYFFIIKESINYTISKNITSRSIKLYFNDFSSAYNGQYSCGAIDDIYPNITLTLYYNGSGLFHLNYDDLIFVSVICLLSFLSFYHYIMIPLFWTSVLSVLLQVKKKFTLYFMTTIT